MVESTGTDNYGDSPMWEYLVVELPSFVQATHAPGASAAVQALNEEGERGWEAVGMIPKPDGRIAVLFKRTAET